MEQPTMMLSTPIKETCAYVIPFLDEQLDPHFYFHNSRHTVDVVTASLEIGLQAGLAPKELEIILLAAYFHDIGYAQTYKDHELASTALAKTFLRSKGLDQSLIDRVVDCILATRFPQQPRNLLEMIICDADLYHFSVNGYLAYAEALKLEWQQKLKLNYSDKQWNSINLELLQNHQYFTAYGKNTLQQRKEKNICLLKQLI